MRLFCLDLSTRVGWALFDGPASRPKFGTHKLPKAFDPEDIARRTLPLRIWLRERITMFGPEALAFEAPWIPMGEMGTNQNTLRLQVSLAAEVETTARECGLKHVIEVASSQAKLALAGTGRVPHKEKPVIMVRAAHARDWLVADDHQADAGAVGLVAYRDLGFDVVWTGEEADAPI